MNRDAESSATQLGGVRGAESVAYIEEGIPILPLPMPVPVPTFGPLPIPIFILRRPQ
jgi:hypothetical protein